MRENRSGTNYGQLKYTRMADSGPLASNGGAGWQSHVRMRGGQFCFSTGACDRGLWRHLACAENGHSDSSPTLVAEDGNPDF